MLYLNYFFALENGYFKDEGINVTSIIAKNGPTASQAVVSGQVDVGIARAVVVRSVTAAGGARPSTSLRHFLWH